MAAGLDTCARYPRGVDLSCINSFQVDQLQRILNDSVIVPSKDVVRRHDSLHFLPSLMALDLPAFRLPAKELVAVQESGLFTAWQRAFAIGLERARNLPADVLLNPSAEAVNVLHDELQAASRQVAMDARKSSVLQSASTGFLCLGMATAAGAFGE